MVRRETLSTEQIEEMHKHNTKEQNCELIKELSSEKKEHPTFYRVFTLV
jgi:hypothetical protein